ncbi:MAG: glycosyltransferase family 4 protein [Candidatus Taylorbacteria bacterium]|nr:glycosyltransferase family 4 protein [Candidatus Taylorbacteria bacterium]
MKKILIFSLVYYPRFVGGAEVAVKEITDRISPDEIAFDMLTLRDNMAPKEKVGNSTIYRTIPGFIPISLAKYLFPFFACVKALSLARKNHYDATWSIMANYAGFGALFFKLLRPKIPFILTLQEGDPFDYIRKRVGIFYPLFKKIFIKADRVTAISTHLADWAREMGVRTSPIVIPNGVDVRKFQVSSFKFQVEEKERVRQELGFSKDDIVLTTTSRLVEKNAVGDIIEALEYLPENVKLLIIGCGALEPSLRSKVKAQMLEARIYFAGFVSHEKLPPYLWASDIFVRPSRSEGMGNSFIEAMAAGLPVIATPVGGIADFLRDGETGLFCEVGNPKSIAQKVEKLMKDSESRKYIVENASRMVALRYDWHLIAEQMKRKVFNAL